MNHLSNKTVIGIMVFYSVLTFFLGPYLVGLVLKDNPHVNIIGFNKYLKDKIIFYIKDVWYIFTSFGRYH